MGIDEAAKRFFHTDVKMQSPMPGETYACVRHVGLYFIAAGPIVQLTEAEAMTLNAVTRHEFKAGIMERLNWGRTK